MDAIKFSLALVLLFSNSNFMDILKFENLLGKHVSTAKDFTGCDFNGNNIQGKNFTMNIYTNDELINKYFYGMKYNFITILTDDQEIIQSITIHFYELINREFYDTFNKDYGKPDHIQVVENRRTVSESFGKGFFQHLKKSTFDLREGTFEENPLYIIWKRKHFQIKAFLRQQNMSEITFSISAD
ncbi:MAG: hypothetical protein KDC67_12800 [Ignavibacteriae bacterium]|nr:hypothetical protein [Ignavibacteriota bacterium]